jgi:hypothetical protein
VAIDEQNFETYGQASGKISATLVFLKRIFYEKKGMHLNMEKLNHRRSFFCRLERVKLSPNSYGSTNE